MGELAPEEVEIGTAQVEDSLGEDATQNHRPLIYPLGRDLRDDLGLLSGRTIWAIDGGVLTWRFPGGRLLLGRAVAVKMTFTGYHTVQRIIELPLVPFIIDYPPPLRKEVEEAVEPFEAPLTEYLFGLLPEEVTEDLPSVFYISDTDEFLDTVDERFHAMQAPDTAKVRSYVDMIRNAAETLAFVYALRQARDRDLVMRDGRVWGGIGFITGLERTETGCAVSQRFVEEIKDATNRGVVVMGIIKRPIASYSLAQLFLQGVEQAQYAPSDVDFYHQLLPGGKRSNLWRLLEKGERTGVVKWFYENTGCFYLKVRNSSLPYRIDFITSNNMYKRWIEDMADMIFTLGLGSGVRSGLPHPILIADSHAKVHRLDVNRFLTGLITQLEELGETDEARRLKAYLGFERIQVGGTHDVA